MTLAECVARYHADHADRVALTPKAAAEVTARRLARQLADVEPQDRADVLSSLPPVA